MLLLTIALSLAVLVFTYLLWRLSLDRSKGWLYTKCSCPIWCDGEIDGNRIRKAMDTRDWARANRNLARFEDPT